jgi:hypothetical protein
MTSGENMASEDWLPWADRVYFGAAIAAVVATAITIVAGIAQNRLNARISDNKDRAFNEFRITSDTRVAELQKLTAEANQRAEEERLARIKIEERLAPRSIAPERFVNLVAALSRFRGTSIAVWQVGEAAEIGNVSQSAFLALRVASWDVNFWVWVGVGPVAGIIISVQPGADVKLIEAADALATALTAAGLSCSREQWPAEWGQVGGMHNGPLAPTPASVPLRLIIGAKP